ncbi:MAG: hypothetical protein ACRD3W_28825, partial [Terriglobales bacterium]
MPMTGLPNESVLNGAGVLTKPDGGFTPSQLSALQGLGLDPSQVQSQLQQAGIDPSHMTAQDLAKLTGVDPSQMSPQQMQALQSMMDPNNAANISPAQQMDALQKLAAEEGVNGMQLVDQNGQAVNPNQLGNLPPGELLKAVGDNGQVIAQMDPNSGQWSAANTNGAVTMGANGDWLANGHVPVATDASGNWSAAGTNGAYAYDPNSGNFTVPSVNGGNDVQLPATALGGTVLQDNYNGVPSANAVVSALSQPDAISNLQPGSDLYRAAQGDPLAGVSVMAQQAVQSGDPSYISQVAQSLGVSDSQLTSAASNPIAAAQVMAAEAYQSPAFASNIASTLQVPPDLVQQSINNPVAAAQLMAADCSYSGNTASVAQAMNVPPDLISSAPSNPLAATQLVAAEAAGNQTYARDIAPQMNVSPDTLTSAANNPIAAAQVLAAEAQYNPSYGSYVSQQMGVPQDSFAQIQQNPMAAAQFVGMEAAANPTYASYASQAMNCSPDIIASAGNNPVAAAQIIGAEAAMSPQYAQQVASSLNMSPDMVVQASSNP